ncbi:class I adenylate-forming enzyme family protein [Blastochloris viridis]|nr:AMP-binding protein [Blastochloris viridis]
MRDRTVMLPVNAMLRRSALDLPDKEAIAWHGQRVTYAELDEASSRIAAFLHQAGVERGMRVAIYSAKCIEEVAAIFAVMKIGAVLVHINPAFRDDKLNHVLTECEPAALFFHPSKHVMLERSARAAVLPPLVIRLSAEGAVASAFPDANLVPAIELSPILRGLTAAGGVFPEGSNAADDLAAIIYTSGTTASAKGIMVTHQILSDATLVSAQVLGNVADDRLISLTPFSFDGALSQLFTMTLVGGTLVLQDSLFPKDVVATLAAERITGAHAVPSFWRLMQERYPAFADRALPCLRYLSLIGEHFSEPDLLRLKRALASTDFYMMYGTTEAFRSTCLAPEDFFTKLGSAGRPLPGVTITVVDENGQPCPTGTVGEVVHAGAFVSPGYWKRPHSATFRNGRVHTGDLGRLDADGCLYFVGRKDTMVKRFGYQLYPEEVEACLLALNGVALAAVVCGADSGGGPALQAFIVCRHGSTLTKSAVTQHCRRHLPHYMVPDDIAFVASLPTTANGKIDRAGLRLEQV